jgi:KDO2-lipid IV(A) lauroyltransferase
MYLHALLPFRLLYILSDILYLFVYKVVGYRLKVVRMNLKNSFPEKTEKELLTIERRFYHHFCDYFVETLKQLHISDEEMQKRMQFENVEQIKDLMKDGNSVLMFLGHYCNWEWIPSITLDFKGKDKDKILGQIYKPLRNKAFDDLFLKIRSRFGSLGIAKNDTLRVIVKLRKEKRQVFIGFMADQTPSVNNIHYWSSFLNQESAVFTGVERIAKQTGYAVIYLDMEKIKRGYYKATVRLITDKAKEEPEFYITETYIRAMEKTILRDPAYWLWTHKRWKRKRKDIEAVQHK